MGTASGRQPIPPLAPWQPCWPAPHWRPAEVDRAGHPGDPTPPPAPVPAPPARTAALPPTRSSAFLLQAQFSASPSEIATVRSVGYTAWINAQFAAPLGAWGGTGSTGRGYAAVSDTSNFYDQSCPADHDPHFSDLDRQAAQTRPGAVRDLRGVAERAGLQLAQPRHPAIIIGWWPMRLATTGRFCRS